MTPSVAAFPNAPEGYTALVGTLRDLALFDDADEVAAAALPRFADSIDLWLAYAWTAHFRHDWPEAVQRWAQVRQRFPNERLEYVMAAKTMFKELGQVESAEPILADAVQRFSSDLEVRCDYAAVAGARGDFTEALLRWQALSLECPGEVSVIAGRGDAEMRLLNTFADAAHAVIVSESTNTAASEIAEKPLFRDFFSDFESLGFNCEFGLVQRHFGAEPLGLLRWNASTPSNLIAALESRFDCLHSADDIELKIIRGEWIVVEKRYDLVMHTFLMEAEVKESAERFRVQMWRRLRCLRDKLIEDLTLGHKLLVYKCWETLSYDSQQRLFTAVRAYGDNTLLYVHEGASVGHVGDVELLEPGLMIGQIDRFVREDQAWSTLSIEAWRLMCRNAHHLWRSQRSFGS